MGSVHWKLYMSFMTGFMSYMCIGAIIAFPSPAFPRMRFREGDHALSVGMMSWLASFCGLFAIPGSIIVVPIMNKFGRKFALIVITLPLVIGWLLVVVALNIVTLAIGRAIAGLALGMELGCLFVYVAEISPKTQRGIFANIPNIFLAVGSIMVNLAGNYIEWRWNAVMCLAMATTAALLSGYMYETPRWLVSKGYHKAAVEVIKVVWKLENPDEIKDKIEEIENDIKLVTTHSTGQVLVQLFKPPLWKPLVISQLLIAFQQLTGTAYINSFTVEIFEEISKAPNHQHSIMDNPYFQSSLVWLANGIGTFLSIFMIDRFGRRILLISTSVLITISLAAIGIYYYIKPLYYLIVVEYCTFIPIVSLFVYNFSFGAGFAGIPYLLLSEIFPLQVRVIASSMGIVNRNLYFFIVAKIFPTLSNVVPKYVIYWIFGSVGLVGLIFIIFFIPETKGKSLEEIQQQWYTSKKPESTNEV